MSVETELCGATEVKVKRGESRGAYLARLAETAYKLEENVWDSLSGPAQAWVNEAVKANDREEDPIDPPADGRQRATHHRLTNKEIEEITSGEEEEGTQEEEQPQRGGVDEGRIRIKIDDETSEEDNDEMTDTEHRPWQLLIEESSAPQVTTAPSTKIKLPEEAAKLSMQERMAKARAARKPKAAVERPVARAERRPIERAARAAPAPRGRAKKAEKAGPTARVMVRQLVAKNPRITKEALLDRIRAAGYVAETRSIITWRYDVLQILRMLSSLGS